MHTISRLKPLIAKDGGPAQRMLAKRTGEDAQVARFCAKFWGEGRFEAQRT